MSGAAVAGLSSRVTAVALRACLALAFFTVASRSGKDYGATTLSAAEPTSRQDESVADRERAAASDHWAFHSPVRRALPRVRRQDWPRRAFDRFVLARLEAEGLEPSATPDRARLIRRLSIDLIGLPPSIEEVDAFVNDPEPRAYEKVVDRLLASPHFGERWTLWWLDLARYADSNGYESDRTRSIWPYRDWVIEQLAADLPFDRFAIEQMAGDMLPDASASQLIATGFHRNTFINEEGGHDWEQFRWESVVDRVHTTATVFLGLTVACAQCHDHKYDPISQREYWELFAFLNNTDEPEIEVLDASVEQRQKEIDAEIERRIAARANNFPYPPELNDAAARNQHLESKLRAWCDSESKRAIEWQILDPLKASSLGNATFTELDDRSLLVTGDRPEVDTYELLYEVPTQRITGFRLEAIPDSRLPHHGPGRGSFMDDGTFVVTEFNVESVPSRRQIVAVAPPKRRSGVAFEFSKAHATFQHSGRTVDKAIDGDRLTSWHIKDGGGKRHVAVFETTHAYDIEPGSRLKVTIVQNFVHQQTLGRFRLYVTDAAAPLHANIRSTAIDAALRRNSAARTEAEWQQLKAHYLSVTPELTEWNKGIDELQATRPRLPTTMVFTERHELRPTHVHERGEHLRPTTRVSPGVPQVLHGLLNNAAPNRLTFARWLVDRRNPLVGRVIVNQLWQAYFGRGIVSTPEDFGTRGAPPSHPRVLDWLALDFADAGWSLKAIHREIVLSATYRQDSHLSAALAERDPDNVLLARGPRLRVDAEVLRDTALATSGLLVRKIGGPSVFPPQPAEAGVSFGPFRWKDSVGDDRYRRGLYTFRKRGAPYAAFATFDAPAPNTCAAARRRSNTPLQALALLNDVVLIEAAQAMAMRTLSEAPSTDAASRARYAFRLCVARQPTESELAAIVAFFERQQARFVSGSLDAAAITGSAGEGAPQAELNALAAWTTVARMLLNLDETISKG